ncbi:hypothetical protein N8I77_011204 [Diaporthe amygdali]|uniref:Uncharacterized protein n=1 Tax=Phomopsis amygdali TaxID=1214568 RepID=A0AAD9VY38_PHOAM|nr:hypothetical protein N8I77_011204 [Diaporthe amygdali]
MYKLVQLFALGLAASTAASGLQVSTASNAGLARRVASQALMAFAVPALAVPFDNAGLATKRNETAQEDEDDDDDEEDDEEDSGDDEDDASDDADDDLDDAANDKDDQADDADDDADDAADE